MTIFVRKISKAKWPSEEEIAEKALDSEIIPFVRADALTTCLKTSQNTLSVWAVENCTDAEIEKAILALITNTKLERLNRIQIVYFSKENDNLHCKSLKYNNKIIGAWRVTRLITRFSLGRGKIKPTRCGLLYQILAYTLQLSV
ncbi:TPA: hypothetical protein ACNRNA_003693 [Acinetobacter baumannii]